MNVFPKIKSQILNMLSILCVLPSITISGQFFLGGSSMYRLNNPDQAFHNKSVRNHFAFQVAMDKQGRFGVNTEKGKKSGITIESENEVTSNLNQDIRGQTFDINRHPSIRHHFKRHMSGFQRDILSQVHNAHSVYIPELIHKMKREKEVHFKSHRVSRKFARMQNRFHNIRRNIGFKEKKRIFKNNVGFFDGRIRQISRNHLLGISMKDKIMKEKLDKIKPESPFQVKKKDLKFFLNPSGGFKQKKGSIEYLHVKHAPSFISLSKSKGIGNFR
jgi:hypothetical protein